MDKIQKKKLSREKFFQIVDEVPPGGRIDELFDIENRRRLYFERISMDGLEGMHSYSKDERLYQYLTSNPSRTIKDTKIYLENFISQIGDDVNNRKRMVWFLKTLNNRQIIGTASLLNIDYDMQSVEWSYGIDPDLWGQGYVFEIQAVLKSYVFVDLKLNEIYGSASVENKLTIKTLKRGGMRETGIKKDTADKSNDNPRILWCYHLLSNEYFAKEVNENKDNAPNPIDEIRLYRLVQEVLRLEKTPADDLVFGELSIWDSLRQMELVARLERQFSVQFTTEEIVNMQAVKDIKEILRAR